MALSLSEDRRAELALFLYKLDETRPIACDIAATCEPMIIILIGTKPL